MGIWAPQWVSGQSYWRLQAYDVAGDGQAHAHSAAFTFGGVERFEDLGNPPGGNARSPVHDGHSNRDVVLPGRDSDAATFRRHQGDRVHGVHQKVQQHLLKVRQNRLDHLERGGKAILQQHAAGPTKRGVGIDLDAANFDIQHVGGRPRLAVAVGKESQSILAKWHDHVDTRIPVLATEPITQITEVLSVLEARRIERFEIERRRVWRAQQPIADRFEEEADVRAGEVLDCQKKDGALLPNGWGAWWRGAQRSRHHDEHQGDGRNEPTPSTTCRDQPPIPVVRGPGRFCAAQTLPVSHRARRVLRQRPSSR